MKIIARKVGIGMIHFKRLKNQRGFTLLEALLVVAIIAMPGLSLSR
jgi:prepilin-type N-terminal cleavage/methylation domain-containing protein